ncbi:MAG: cysteine--1-D-myo-inosityl 2-amino-2-deoxy-alpha-D-glucopyranoside ligase [Actinomycetes bacterium]
MLSWAESIVPVVPGDDDQPVLLFDTAQGAMVNLLDHVAQGEAFRLYVCGITPYDAAHLGHASTYLAFDLVQRTVRDAGLPVRYVQNVTDVDDPLLERALMTGDHWSDLAEREIQRFREDMQALRVLPPDEFIGVVESIPDVVRLIEQLKDANAAYQVEQDWYFDLSTASGFASVTDADRDTMIAVFGERGGDPQRPGKRDALDPLLWMAARGDDPRWETSLGSGRPGWHIECVAIAAGGLGAAFDLQGGGSDLTFPHHHMCSALGHAVTGEPFATHYAHTGMVALDGEKMSKSKGNLEFVSRLRQGGADPMAIRLALITQHYRSDWEWTAQHLTEATSKLALWREAVARASAPDPSTFIARIRSALRTDLNSPLALQIMDEWVSATGETAGAGQQMASAIDALLGVDLT